MSDRETKIIEVADHKFEVYTYATAREAATIQQAYFKGAKIEVVNAEPKISEFNPNIQFEVKLEMIRQMVVRMDNLTENIVDRCEALPSDVFDELATELDGLVIKKKS